MESEYITVSWLDPLRRRLTKPQWQNLILLIVALQFAHTFIGRQLTLYLICLISSSSCYRAILGTTGEITQDGDLMRQFPPL